MRLRSLLVSAALLLAGCADSSSAGGSPKETLEEALANLRVQPGVTASLTLRSTPGSLQALADDGGEQLSAEDAAKILDSSLTISAENSSDPAEAASRVVVNAAGQDALEIRTVDVALYVRADVRYLLELFGQPPSAADAFVGQASSAGLDFVGPLVEGRWIAVTGFEELMGQGAATPSAEQAEAIEELLAALRSSASVSSEGDDAAGEHLVASVSLREVARDLGRAASKLGQGVAGGGLPSPQEVPDQQVALDLWIDEGRLTRVEFDFLQLRDVAGADFPAGVESLAVRIDLAEFSGEVEVPADAVPVDLRQVMQGFMGGFPAQP